ncbi:hypothetical protein EDB82DRAFT_336457 [Fusarium venenatum]|uniref:uncharacterized protein n=1 Tax=Fusarium venenatum TaxID=56646 RepID=UPI001D43ED50|nr:hypothetical protein EDB82DRAFT_336457 [Fusarium venenatum]
MRSVVGSAARAGRTLLKKGNSQSAWCLVLGLGWVMLLCLAGLGVLGCLARNNRELDRYYRSQSVGVQLLRYFYVVGLGEVMQFTAARLLVFGGRSGDAPEKPCWNTQVYLRWEMRLQRYRRSELSVSANRE